MRLATFGNRYLFLYNIAYFFISLKLRFEDRLRLGIKNEQVPFFSSRLALSLHLMKKAYYIVAEHSFCVEADENIIKLLSNYAPFITEATTNTLFCLTVADGGPIQHVEELS